MADPLCIVLVESTAIVANAQSDTPLQHLERHASLSRVAMLDTITYRFLDDAEQVEGLFRRYGPCGAILDREAHTRRLVLRQHCQHLLQHCRKILPQEQV